MNESEELNVARAEVGQAITKFTTIQARERGVALSPVIVGWGAFAEYTSIELEPNDQSGNVVIVPDHQSASTSRGVFSFGVDAFTRVSSINGL